MSYLLLCSTYTTLLLLVYYIGQRVTNQNDLFRRGLAKLQWIGKPIWFKRTLLIMMIKANTDIEIKPYSLYVLNLTSYKDIMKAAFTYGNIMYSRKST
ncbi:uncharacterized protein LOC120351843 [Nilaparvata lugens]|nr:uncharacterized protein LOC120351843 [Nilaparvata lugens]